MATGRAALIARLARERGLDPDAVLSIGGVEGGFDGAIGDHGTSFGFAQLHMGGALPAQFNGHPKEAQQWANSTEGITYAVDGMARVAAGLRGKAAIAAIASKFERPADVPGEIAKASARYGSNLGSDGPLTNLSGGTLGNDRDALRKAFAMQMLSNVVKGQSPDPMSVLGLATARQQFSAVQDTYGGTAPAAGMSGAVKWEGDLKGVNPSFAQKVAGAAQIAGATSVRITSGYRDPQHNKAVGGVPNSNHTSGHAIDGEAFVPGHGWIPLGTLLRDVAGKFGLRSGDVPGFYRGGRDPVHVDDGLNQRGVM